MPASATGSKRVGDHQVLLRQLALHAVQRLQHFALAGAANDDLAALQLVEVEGVGGLADFVENVIAWRRRRW